MNRQQELSPEGGGWTTDTELVREFTRPVNIADAVSLTVDEATDKWAELSETPPLYDFVDAESLDGLFKTNPTDCGGFLPSATFNFQGCRIEVLYGASVRVVVRRDP